MRGKRKGFSLIEVLVVIGIVAVLVVITVPVTRKLIARAQRLQCMGNLRSLHVAANLYVQENNVWPQIPLPDDEGVADEHARAWIAALKPHGALEKTWICPTMQNHLGKPDYISQPRVDYTGMTFDDKPATPYKWPTQPWFVETGDMHGNGNLIIFTDGSIKDLKTIAARPGR